MENETKIENFDLNPRAQGSWGFTLIELLVVIFIMVTISTISVANFRQGEKRKRAVIAADTVTAALRAAQNSAITGRRTNNSDANCRTAQYYYTKFTYTSSIEVRALNNCSTDDLMETFTLPTDTRVKANGLTINSSSVAVTSLSVYFTAPFGSTRAANDGGASATYTTAAVAVQTADGVINRTVIVDGVAGRIGE